MNLSNFGLTIILILLYYWFDVKRKIVFVSKKEDKNIFIK